jgi:hypothetical protein
MGATTTEGTGPGSVYNLKPLILNGNVQASNLGPNAVAAAMAGEVNFVGVSAPVGGGAGALTMNETDHAGKVIVSANAAGNIIVLPASSGNGAKYTFVVRTTVTSNNLIVKVANASDSFVGRAIASSDNATTTNNIWNISSGDDTITLNGSTKGGYAGDYIEIIDMGGNLFAVNAFLTQTATEATPFSATVS